MIITCPNCTTKYNVQPALIGNGRSTRCYNCGHMWHQAPVVSPPPPPIPPQPQPQMAAQPPMPTQPQMMAHPQAVAMAPGQPMTQAPMQAMAQAPMQAMAQAPMPVAPVPEPVAAPRPDPVPAPAPAPKAEDALDDFDLDGALDNDKKDAPAAADQDADDISIADLDEMFGDDDDVEPMTSIMDGEEEDEFGTTDIDPEDLPDPDPVPDMFTPENDDDDDEPRKSGFGKIIGVSIVILLLALPAALFFARDMVMDRLPFTKALYQTIGLGEKVGAGLNLSKPKIDYGTDKGKSTMVIQGLITNVSEDPRPVPMLKVILRDAEKQNIQTTVAPPRRNELPAGERMGYKITVVDPSPLARSIAVIFIKPEDVKKK